MAGTSRKGAFPGANALRQAATALWLRAADRVGPGAVVVGRPHLTNDGAIRIGSDFRLSARPATSHLVTLHVGVIEIGDRVQVGHGAAISAIKLVRIGNDVRLGPFVVIMDSDFHVVGDDDALAVPEPVTIGNGVVIGQRVTILKGSTIGDGARVESGSVVSGDVAAGSVVSGVPAAPLGASSGSNGERPALPEVVREVFRLPHAPAPSDGPDTIPQWSSLGALKLLLVIEQRFGVNLTDVEMSSARSVAALDEVVRNAERRRAAAP